MATTLNLTEKVQSMCHMFTTPQTMQSAARLIVNVALVVAAVPC